MATPVDANYVRARSGLLDALAALGPLREAAVLVGAQAIYEYTRDHAVDYAVSPFTFDADLALIPELLVDDPKIIDAMQTAGYSLTDQPGIYRRDDGVQVDLLVPEAVGGRTGRGAGLGVHGNRAARQVCGLEGRGGVSGMGRGTEGLRSAGSSRKTPGRTRRLNFRSAINWSNGRATMKFGELKEVDLREAWPHEGNDFTPWLAGNLERLSRGIDMRLELEGTEVAVGQFSADILARNLDDDSRVLIENQYGATDHRHLGQILTYLAGLEAHTIIWIAQRFEDAHLSAIRWLNEHTIEPFAFLAVQLKVLQIADSPLVPQFQVLERPSNWDRQIRDAQRGRSANAIGQLRREFWEFYVDRHPGDIARASAASNQWVYIEEAGLNISLAWFRTRSGCLSGAFAEKILRKLASASRYTKRHFATSFQTGQPTNQSTIALSG